MFEKIGQSAEKVVGKVSVSRRGFLGNAAKVAATVGAALAGLAAFPVKASAGPALHKVCVYTCPSGRVVRVTYPLRTSCPEIEIRRKEICPLTGSSPL
jgi:polyferredoxin